MLTSLHYYYRGQEKIQDARSVTSVKKATQFARLSIDLAMQNGDYNAADSEDEDDSDVSEDEA